MKKSDKLKQERKAILDAQNVIVQRAKTENREFTPEEQAELTAKDGEVDALDAKIETAVADEKREARIASMAGTPVGGGEQREIEKIAERVSFSQVLRSLKEKGASLEGAVKELHEIGLAENRAAGVNAPEDTAFSIPLRAVNRATQQTVSQDSGQYGGALVQDQDLRMIENLKPKLFLEELGAMFFMGLQGGDLPLITSDAFAMAYVGEVDSITPQKQKFAGKKLSPKRTAGAVDISNRLLSQSSVDVDLWIMNQLRDALGVAIQTAAINGTGSGDNPTGLLQMTGINTSGDTAAVVAVWEKLTELQGLIEEDNAGNSSLGYLIHPKVKAALKAIKKDTGSGLFLMEDGMIDGIKTVSSSLVPLLTNVYPIIFGDWKEMFIGQWGSLNISANPYSADLANSTRFVFNTYTDSTVVNEKAFAVNKWIKGGTS